MSGHHAQPRHPAHRAIWAAAAAIILLAVGACTSTTSTSTASSALAAASAGPGGVAAAVNRTSFSIGYVEQAYSQGLTLPFAALRNQAGNYRAAVRCIPTIHPPVKAPDHEKDKSTSGIGLACSTTARALGAAVLSSNQ